MYDRDGSESVAIRDSILRNGLHVSPSPSSESVVVDECQWERRRSCTTMLVNLDRSLNIEFNSESSTHTFLFLYYHRHAEPPQPTPQYHPIVVGGSTISPCCIRRLLFSIRYSCRPSEVHHQLSGMKAGFVKLDPGLVLVR